MKGIKLVLYLYMMGPNEDMIIANQITIFDLVSFHKQPEEVIVTNEENKALIQAMTKLKRQERQVLSMKFATDLKNNEIAKIF